MPGTGLARDHSKAAELAWKTMMPKMVRLMKGARTPQRSGTVLADLLSGKEYPDGTGLLIEFSRQEIESPPLSHNESKQDDLIGYAESVIAALV